MAQKKTKKIDMSSQPAPTAGGPVIATSDLVEVRNSPVHGRGVFAVKPIPKKTRIIEYLGDRISHDAADKRYEDHDESDNHTFLFIVDKKTVIDAGVGGNDARFINHQCEGNCESKIENRRVFIYSTRAIAPGEELGYDYEIGREKDDPDNVDEIYACRCGSPKCRGTMLWPAKKPEPKSKKKTSRKKSKAGKKSTAGKKARSRNAEKARAAARTRGGEKSRRAGKSGKTGRRPERSRRRA